MGRSLYLVITTLLVLLSLYMAATTTLALGRKGVPAVYTVTSYKAKPKGGGGSSSGEESLKSAWLKACKSGGPATLNVTERLFNEGPVEIDGTACNNEGVITFEMQGTTHQAPDHTEFGKAEVWVKFYKVQNVIINGGVLDAQAETFYECKDGGGCSGGATTLGIHNSKRVTITGVTLQNSQMFHMEIVDSQDITVSDITIEAPENSPNTDGIHVSRSSQVKITDSNIGTGDDCISMGPGCTTMTVDKAKCGPGHGISIGSLGKEDGEDPVAGITVQNVEFRETTNGVRIKTFPNGKTGHVSGVVFQHLTMDGVKNPLIIDQFYESSGGDSGVQIDDVKYIDITGTSATEDAVVFQCSDSCPCTGIEVSGVDLSFDGNKPEAACKNVHLVAGTCTNVFV